MAADPSYGIPVTQQRGGDSGGQGDVLADADGDPVLTCLMREGFQLCGVGDGLWGVRDQVEAAKEVGAEFGEDGAADGAGVEGDHRAGVESLAQGPVRYDGQGPGRQRHVVVDEFGLLLAVMVTAASDLRRPPGRPGPHSPGRLNRRVIVRRTPLSLLDGATCRARWMTSGWALAMAKDHSAASSISKSLR